MDLELNRPYHPRQPLFPDLDEAFAPMIPYPRHRFFGAGFDELFAPIIPRPRFMQDPFEMMPVLPNFDRSAEKNLLRSSPGYEITERSDGMYQISVDVPGIKASDMKVELEHEGRVVHITGGRKITKDDQSLETKFDKRFTIGHDIESEKMTANLADGVLVLKAPKKEVKEPPKFTIPITERPHDKRAAKL